MRHRNVVSIAGRTLLAMRRNALSLVAGGIAVGLAYYACFASGVVAAISAASAGGMKAPDYRQWVVPGIVAIVITNASLPEAIDGTFARAHYDNTYKLIALAPISFQEIVWGETFGVMIVSYVQLIGVLGILVALSEINLSTALILFLAAAPSAAALAVLGIALALSVNTPGGLDVVRFALLPLTIFSGALFPTQALAAPLRIAIEALPPFHVAELMRMAVIADLGAITTHVLYLGLTSLLAAALAARKLAAILIRR